MSATDTSPADIFAACKAIDRANRKPHNHLEGYVCELKSKHHKLPGYFAVFARDKGGDWVTGTDGDRYAVAHIKPDNTMGCVVCTHNLPTARAVMKDMAAGGNIADLGQYEDNL